jgi:superfamily I DNA/RNA helicase
MSWLIPLDELTPDQIRAIQLDIDQNHAILGAPGSGKTQVLLHRARHLSDEHEIDPERFHIFVFTNVLKNYIRSGLTDLELPEDCVTTLDDWCVQVYRQEISMRLPWSNRDRCPDYTAIRGAVHEIVADQQPFDFILVDEGQDLDEAAFALLKDLAPHVTVAMDHKQQIYDEGSERMPVKA